MQEFQSLQLQDTEQELKPFKIKEIVPQKQPIQNGCVKCMSQKQIYNQLCRSCHQKHIEYRCRVFFKQKLPEFHKGVLIGYSKGMLSQTLCQVIHVLRSTYISKVKRGIELNVQAIHVGQLTAFQKQAFEGKYSFGLTSIAGDESGWKQNLTQYALKEGFHFIATAETSNNIAVVFLYDLIKGLNPLDSFLRPFQNFSREDVLFYISEEAEEKSVQKGLKGLVSTFLEGLQKSQGHTMRTVVCVKDKISWQ